MPSQGFALKLKAVLSIEYSDAWLSGFKIAIMNRTRIVVTNE